MGTQTLLNYELTTEPFPLRASTTTGTPNGKFTIVASNPNPDESVTIKRITIRIPLGTSGAALSIGAPPDPIPPADWKCETRVSDGVVEYAFKPNVGKGQVGEQGLAFIFNAIQVNMQPGTVDVKIGEEVRDGEATSDLKITKFPAGWGKVEFWANPEIISAGDSTTLNWHGPAGATYSIYYYIPQQGVVYVPAEGEKPLADKGQYRTLGELERYTIFYLTVKALVDGQEYIARQTVVVTVQSVKITATGPDDPVNALEPVEIKWRTQSAQTVTLEPGKQTAKAISGSGTFTVRPTSDTTYTLIAKDANGREKRAVVAVYVNPPQITTFKATPSAVKPGTVVTLLWVTKSSAFTSLAPGIGKVDPSGIAKVTVPLGNTSYVLTAQSQPPFAIETVNIIGAQAGFHLMASDKTYENVEGALVLGRKLYLVDVHNNRVWFSIDGQTLTPIQAETPSHEFLDGYRTVVFDAGKGPRIWVLGGRNTRMDPSNSVWRATDETGKKWEQVTPVNNKIWSPRCFFGCVVFKQKIWVFGGTDGSGNHKHDVWSSPDGANWTLETENAGWSPRAYFATTTFTLGESTNQIWLCGGVPGKDYTNECYYTNDGVQWLKYGVQTVPWEPRAAPLLQQIGESLWLMGGSISNSTPLRDVWTIGGPPQSHIWTRHSQDAPWPIADQMGAPWASVVFNGVMWCAGSNAQYGPNPGIWFFLP
jgi:hypothetical protein